METRDQYHERIRKDLPEAWHRHDQLLTQWDAEHPPGAAHPEMLESVAVAAIEPPVMPAEFVVELQPDEVEQS